MTREELISLTIDKYTDLQRIKKANGNTENKELEGVSQSLCKPPN